MTAETWGFASDRPALVLHDLRKDFGTIAAVDGIDLEVRRGEFLTLLGPSGSGKTTTLRMVAGFMAPTSGSIEIDGTDMTRVPPYRRDVGMVFQNYALFPHMTAADNVAFPLRMRRRPAAEIKSRVAEALELVKLGSHGDRYPRQLSGGQQQRIALAAPSSSNRGCSSWTSRSARSTGSSASRCSSRSSGSAGSSARPCCT